jgi:hypothetical protein
VRRGWSCFRPSVPKSSSLRRWGRRGFMSIVSFAVKENENSKCIRGHAAYGISPGCALGRRHETSQLQPLQGRVSSYSSSQLLLGLAALSGRRQKGVCVDAVFDSMRRNELLDRPLIPEERLGKNHGGSARILYSGLADAGPPGFGPGKGLMCARQTESNPSVHWINAGYGSVRFDLPHRIQTSMR